MVRAQVTSAETADVPRTTNTRRLGRRVLQAACIGATAAALTLSATPVSHADGQWGELVSSYLRPTPDDAGGYDARVTWDEWDGHGIYQASFQARGETLRLSDYDDGKRAQAEVRVYEHVDVNGVPYGLVDTDNFSSSAPSTTYNLGTPDGSGNIPDGYWVAIRVSFEGQPWSSWAYGVA